MARPIPQVDGNKNNATKLNEHINKLTETIKPKETRSFVDITVDTIKDKSTKNLVLGTITARPGRPPSDEPRPAVIQRPEPYRPDEPIETLLPTKPFPNPPKITPSSIPNPNPSVTANKPETPSYKGLPNKIPGFSAFQPVHAPAPRYPSPIQAPPASHSSPIQPPPKSINSNPTEPTLAPTTHYSSPIQPLISNYPYPIQLPTTSVYPNLSEPQLVPTSHYANPIQPLISNYPNPIQPPPTSIYSNPSEPQIAPTSNYENSIQTPPTSLSSSSGQPQLTPPSNGLIPIPHTISTYSNPIQPLTSNYPNSIQSAPTSIICNPIQATPTSNYANPIQNPPTSLYSNPIQPPTSNYLNPINPITSTYQLAPTTNYMNPIQPPTTNYLKPIEPPLAPVSSYTNPVQSQLAPTSNFLSPTKQPTSNFLNTIQPPMSNDPNPIERPPTSVFPSPIEQSFAPVSNYPNHIQPTTTSCSKSIQPQSEPISNYPGPIQPTPTTNYTNSAQLTPAPTSNYSNNVQPPLAPSSNYLNSTKSLLAPTSSRLNHFQLPTAPTSNYSNHVQPLTTATEPPPTDMLPFQSINRDVERDIIDEAQRIEAYRREADRIEAKRLEANRIEVEKIQTYRNEANRIETKIIEEETIETFRREANRLEAERKEAERIETEKIEAFRREANRIEANRTEATRTKTTIIDGIMADILQPQDFEEHIERKIISPPALRQDNRIQPLESMLNITSISQGSGATVTIPTNMIKDTNQKKPERYSLKTSIPISKIDMKCVSTSMDTSVIKSPDKKPVFNSALQKEAIERPKVEIQSNIIIKSASKEDIEIKTPTVTLAAHGNSIRTLINAAEAINKHDGSFRIPEQKTVLKTAEAKHNSVTLALAETNNNKKDCRFQGPETKVPNAAETINKDYGKFRIPETKAVVNATRVKRGVTLYIDEHNNNKNGGSFRAPGPKSVLKTTNPGAKSETKGIPKAAEAKRSVTFVLPEDNNNKDGLFKIPEPKKQPKSKKSFVVSPPPSTPMVIIDSPKDSIVQPAITRSTFAPVVMTESRKTQNKKQNFPKKPPEGGYDEHNNQLILQNKNQKQQTPLVVLKRTNFESKNLQAPSRLSSQSKISKEEVAETSSQVVALKRTHQDNYDENDFENLITENQIYGNKIVVKEKSQVIQHGEWQNKIKIDLKIEKTQPVRHNIVKPNFVYLSNVQFPTNLMMIKNNCYSNNRQVCQTTDSVKMQVSSDEKRSNGMNFVKNIIQETNTIIVKHAKQQSVTVNKEIHVLKSSNNVLQTLSNNNNKTEVVFQTSQKVIMTPFVYQVPMVVSEADKKDRNKQELIFLNNNQNVHKEPKVVPVLKELQKQVETKPIKLIFGKVETKSDQGIFGEVETRPDQRIFGEVETKLDRRILDQVEIKQLGKVETKPDKLIFCQLDTKFKPNIVIANLRPKVASKIEEMSILDIYEKRQRIRRLKYLSNANKDPKPEKKNATKAPINVITPDRMKYEIFKELKMKGRLADSSDSESDFGEDELSEYDSIIDKFGENYNENAKVDFLAGFRLASKEVFREKELDRHERTLKCDSIASAYMAAGLDLVPEDMTETPEAKATIPELENKWTKQKKHLFLAHFKLMQVSPWYKADYEKSWLGILRERNRRNGITNPPSPPSPASPEPTDPDGHLQMLTEINKSVNENNDLIKKRLDSICDENSDIRILAEKNFSELNRLSKMADRSVKLFSGKDTKKRDLTPGFDSENIKKYKGEPKNYHRLIIPSISKIISLKTEQEHTSITSSPATWMDEPADTAKCRPVQASTRDVGCQVDERLLWPGTEAFIKSYRDYDIARKKEIDDLHRSNTRLRVECAHITRAASRESDRARALLAERQHLANEEASLRRSLDRLTTAIQSIRNS